VILRLQAIRVHAAEAFAASPRRGASFETVTGNLGDAKRIPPGRASIVMDRMRPMTSAYASFADRERSGLRKTP
jgi:hypothetical protein